MHALIISSIAVMSLLSRILIHDSTIPVVALALFAAVYLPSQRSSFLVFFGGLFLSDLLLGLHVLIPVVYASLVPILIVGFRLKNNLRALQIARTTMLSSFLYFCFTNLGVWVLGGCDLTKIRQFPPN